MLRPRSAATVLLALGSTVLGGAVVACFDLFHSTGDIRTACELDAETPGCTREASVEAGVDAGTDFCAWPEDEARRNAEHACAWLGACESPLGGNAFGSCMFAALLAYDCSANPDHPVKGKTRALWDCLWRAQSCDAVSACVFPQGPQGCQPGAFVACASPDGAPPNADVRAECVDGGPARGENCALWGQTCGGTTGAAVCGASAVNQAIDCTQDRGACRDAVLHWCPGGDAGEVGIDCASQGAAQCRQFTDGTGTWLACVPESDAGACPADASAACVNGFAISCPAGVVEHLNCQSLLQDVGACTAGPLSPPFDWTSPCMLAQGDASPDGSTCVESCNGTMLTACFRGARFPLDCAAVGLGACGMVATDEGTASHVACSPRGK